MISSKYEIQEYNLKLKTSQTRSKKHAMMGKPVGLAY